MTSFAKALPNSIQYAITHSLAFCVALAWNSAFQELFDRYDILHKYGPFIYAILITIIAVIVSKFFKNIDERNVFFYE